MDINLTDARRLLDLAPTSGRSVAVPNVSPQTPARVSVSPMCGDDTQERTRVVLVRSGAGAASD